MRCVRRQLRRRDDRVGRPGEHTEGIGRVDRRIAERGLARPVTTRHTTSPRRIQPYSAKGSTVVPPRSDPFRAGGLPHNEDLRDGSRADGPGATRRACGRDPSQRRGSPTYSLRVEPEEFFDFQDTRPRIRFSEHDAREITWPGIEVFEARVPKAPRDLVLVQGFEPSMRWRSF